MGWYGGLPGFDGGYPIPQSKYKKIRWQNTKTTKHHTFSLAFIKQPFDA